MKCEICNCSEIIKEDGIFVCKKCGIQYSLKEVKRMMQSVSNEKEQETEESLLESARKVFEESQVENNKENTNLSNYFSLAQNAYHAHNLIEAENYCNKILERNNADSEAWLLKGKTAIWQSSIEKLRIDEGVLCFEKAIENATKSKSDAIKVEIAEELSKFTKSLVSKARDIYLMNPSTENASIMLNCSQKMLRISSRNEI